MFRTATFLLLVSASLTWLNGRSWAATEAEAPNADGAPHYEIWGEPARGLQPYVMVQYYDRQWHFGLDFLSRTNFPDRVWLKIASRIGCRLRMWRSDGSEVTSASGELLAASATATNTTVDDVVQASTMPTSSRGLLWLYFGTDGLAFSSTFSLSDAFGAGISDAKEIQIIPLLYFADTNRVNLRLVDFPPVRIRLLPGGQIIAAHVEHTFWGEEKESLTPILRVTRYDVDWNVHLGFFAEKLAPEHAWFIPADGAGLAVFDSDGAPVPARSAAVAGSNLAPNVAWSALTNALPASEGGRGLQAPRGIASMETRLGAAFVIPPGKKLLLRVMPRLYRDGAHERANLVEFEPFEVSLQTNADATLTKADQ